MSIVVQEIPNVTLLVVGEGDGSERDELTKLANELGLGERVRFLGMRFDIPELLATFDVYASSSVWEGLPMVILEAMAAGCPIVATAVGGLPTAITDNVNGSLVPPHNHEALAAALIGLLRDRERRARYARAGREVFATRYSAEIMARQYEALYERRPSPTRPRPTNEGPRLPDVGVARFAAHAQLAIRSDPENSALFFRGAGAILQAARTIGLTHEDEVLVPAYHCGIEVEAIRHTGARIVFVPLTPSLDLLPDALRARVSRRTKAVLLIHFFGFPQPIKEVRTFCDELGLILIEDCAHALFSGAGASLLGQTGDFSIFSFQKTLPVPDGGALVGRDVSSNRSTLAPPPFLTTVRGIALLLLSSSGSHGGLWETIARWAIITPARAAVQLIKRSRGPHVVVSPSAAELDPVTACLGMSAAAQRIAQHADPGHIIAARRRAIPAAGRPRSKAQPGFRFQSRICPTAHVPCFFLCS